MRCAHHTKALAGAGADRDEQDLTQPCFADWATLDGIHCVSTGSTEIAAFKHPIEACDTTV